MMAQEDEEAFLDRRRREEETKALQSSCMVRSVHEDLAELYAERSGEAAGETIALKKLLDRLP